jgi:hypothetical protein
MEKIVNIQLINPDTLQLQNYSTEDDSLIASNLQEITFNPAEDYIEYFILDLNENILYENTSGFSNYTLIDNLVTIDPQRDLEAQGYTEGQYYTIYNFLKRKLSSSPGSTFYIQDISTDRTELRLNTTQISNSDVIDLTTQFASQIDLSSNSYLDFIVNFGNNRYVIANNIALDNSNSGDPTVLIKLYEPLPEEFNINSQCWVAEQIAESQAYQIELQTIFSIEEESNYIGGPNFNLDIQDLLNNSTPYYNQTTLQQNISSLGSGSLLYQINSLLAEKGIEINVDYTDYSNFVYFSSAQTRLENFYYKLALIEEYTFSASYTTGTSTIYTGGSQQIWQNKINDIITNFDGYEYYLYYESSSYSWPKTNSEYPYINDSTTSVPALAWLSGQLDSASLYDINNVDALVNSIPNYIADDPDNGNYLLFTQMLGQHFDNIWIYLKDITNKFDADNRLEYGISKDIVAQAIRDLGIKIYQNNFSTENLYSSLLGITPSGSLFNVPYVTSSLPTPAGFEYVNTFVTASSTSSLQPLDDVNKEIYKRIYHNSPKLLKKKGSAEGLRMLVNLYGIPDTILRINEFGGKSYQDSSWDNYADQFNYALRVLNGGRVRFTLDNPENGYTPTTLQFRFKTSGIPPSSPYGEILYNSNPHFIYLKYTGTGITPVGVYSGAIPDPYNEYADLIYTDGVNTAVINLPFYNGDWWSVMLTTDGTTDTLYTGNKIYNYDEGSNIGYTGSNSFSGTPFNTTLNKFVTLSSAGTATINGNSCVQFSGSLQELRVYSFDDSTHYLNSSSFFDYVMNPYSIEGNTPSGSESSLDSLFFRAPLGTVLDNDISIVNRISIHPSISTNPPVGSYSGGGSGYLIAGTFTFEPNTETIFQDQFVAGIKNAVSEKIRIYNSVTPYGNTLSQYRSIQQNLPLSASYTRDINYIEAAFSPQDEINDDIIAQLGSFNIGNYIGDPRHLLSLTTSGSLNYYPDFNKLRDNYFSKYVSGSGYDLNDYIRLIKFYDNSLFKMIKDFTPAKSGLASGIVIKQTMLERCRYPQPRANTNSIITFVGNPTSSALNIPY